MRSQVQVITQRVRIAEENNKNIHTRARPPEEPGNLANDSYVSLLISIVIFALANSLGR